MNDNPKKDPADEVYPWLHFHYPDESYPGGRSTQELREAIRETYNKYQKKRGRQAKMEMLLELSFITRQLEEIGDFKNRVSNDIWKRNQQVERIEAILRGEKPQSSEIRKLEDFPSTHYNLDYTEESVQFLKERIAEEKRLLKQLSLAHSRLLFLEGIINNVLWRRMMFGDEAQMSKQGAREAFGQRTRAQETQAEHVRLAVPLLKPDGTVSFVLHEVNKALKKTTAHKWLCDKNPHYKSNPDASPGERYEHFCEAVIKLNEHLNLNKTLLNALNKNQS